MIKFWYEYFGPCGRLRIAWYALRGRPVAYRVVIRDGGLDLRGIDKCIIYGVQIHGADIAIHTDFSSKRGYIIFPPGHHTRDITYTTGETES